MSDESINCRECGDETNHAPEDFPPETDGLCPSCSIKGWDDGTLPKPSSEAMKRYIADAMMCRLMNSLFDNNTSVEIHVMDEPGNPDFVHLGGNAFLVRQCLN